jgi:hypothetical protein
VCLYLIEYDLSYEPLKSVKDQVVAGFTVGRSIDQNIDESCNLVSIHPWKLFVDGEKSSAQYLDLICDESLTYRGLHSNTGHFGSFIFILVLCGESCLIVSCCVGDRWGMMGSDEDRGRSRKPGAEDQRWSSIGRILNGQAIERSDDTVCGLYRAHRDEEREFLG